MILEMATFLRKGFCCNHDQECDLCSGEASVIAVGGNRSLDWSILGRQSNGQVIWMESLGVSEVDL